MHILLAKVILYVCFNVPYHVYTMKSMLSKAVSLSHSFVYYTDVQSATEICTHAFGFEGSLRICIVKP